MQYILMIVYLWAPGPVATTAEFNSKAACEAAILFKTDADSHHKSDTSSPSKTDTNSHLNPAIDSQNGQMFFIVDTRPQKRTLVLQSGHEFFKVDRRSPKQARIFASGGSNPVRQYSKSVHHLQCCFSAI